MTSKERRLAKILTSCEKNAENLKQRHRHSSLDNAYESVFDREKEKRRRLKMLRESDSNVYSSNNKSTLEANKTMNALIKSIQDKNRDPSSRDKDSWRKTETSGKGLFQKKTYVNPGKYQSANKYLPGMTIQHENSIEESFVDAPQNLPAKAMNWSIKKYETPTITFMAERSPNAVSSRKGLKETDPVNRNKKTQRLAQTYSGLGVPTSIKYKKSVKRVNTIDEESGNSYQTSRADVFSPYEDSDINGFTTLAARYTHTSIESEHKKVAEIGALLQICDHTDKNLKVDLFPRDPYEDMADFKLEYPNHKKTTLNILDTYDVLNVPPKKKTRTKSVILSKNDPDQKQVKASRSPPHTITRNELTPTYNKLKTTTSVKIQSVADIQYLHKKFYAEIIAPTGLTTLKELSNPRKDTKVLSGFISRISERIKRENKDPKSMITAYESLLQFSSDHFAKMLKTDNKEYEEIFSSICFYQDFLKTVRNQQSNSNIESLKNQITALRGELSKKTHDDDQIPQNKKSKANLGDQGKDNGDEQAGKKVTPTAKMVETLKGELDMLNKINNSKEKRYTVMMNKLQDRLRYLKTINTSLVSKYNLQSERMNQLKQRLIYYVRKNDPYAEKYDEEEIIGEELVKAMNEQEPTLERANSLNSNGDDDQSPSEGNNQAANAGGMIIVEQIDDFDYSKIYKKRNILRKSHSQKRNPKTYFEDSKRYRYYQKIIKTKDSKQDTKNLIMFDDKSTQSLVSFIDQKYDSVICNQYELESYMKRVTFERGVIKYISDKKHMCFLTDGLMRNLLGLKTISPLPEDTIMQQQSHIPISDSELVSEIKEHQASMHFIDEDEYNSMLRISTNELYFNLNMIDTYISHTVDLPLPVTEPMVKYLFLSYVFIVQTVRKKTDLIQKKEDQVEVLFNLCHKYKKKIIEYDSLLLKSQMDLQNFVQIHKGCNVNHLLTDFKPEKVVVKDTDQFDNRNHMHIAVIINKVKRIKLVMKMSSKKYFSFKIVYQKIYQFFQLRSTEVEFVDGPSVKHPYSIEEHFFRYLTEKENGGKKIEEKIKNFLITIYNLDPNPKIEIFKRFCNLSISFPFSRFEEFFYLKAIEFIRQESRGLEISSDFHEGTNYVPFEKFEGFVQKFIIPRLNHRTTITIWRSLKDLINTHTDAVAKKGIIDLDVAMAVVLKWINTKVVFKYEKEYCFFLFDLVNVDEGGSQLTFRDFLYAYKLLNLNIYGEATRLIIKKDSDEIKGKLTLDDLEEAAIPSIIDQASPEMAWMSSSYIYSRVELKEIFCKYTEQNFKEGEDPSGKMEFINFVGLVNEFENLFDFHKVYSFLRINEANIENEFYQTRSHFIDCIETYTTFVNECKIKDNSWKDTIMGRIRQFKGLFENQQQLNEQMNQLTSYMAQANVEVASEDRLMSHLMTKVLMSYKVFILDLMQCDFEQRLNYAEAKALPFE